MASQWLLPVFGAGPFLLMVHSPGCRGDSRVPAVLLVPVLELSRASGQRPGPVLCRGRQLAGYRTVAGAGQQGFSHPCHQAGGGFPGRWADRLDHAPVGTCAGAYRGRQNPCSATASTRAVPVGGGAGGLRARYRQAYFAEHGDVAPIDTRGAPYLF